MSCKDPISDCGQAGTWFGRNLLLAIIAVMTPALLGGQAWAQPVSKQVRDANVAVRAMADREAIVPGGELNLLISVKPDKEWHIYWQNPAGTGMPTSIEWRLPDGFKAGPTQYPVPSAHFDKDLEETTYILEGESLFLTTVTVPADIQTGKDVSLNAKVSWLACKKECIPGEAEVVLTLPVAEKGAAPRPANAKIFKQAQQALPEPGNKAKHVKITGKLSKETLKPSDTATASFIIDVDSKHHMQSNKPAQEEMIPTILFLESTAGLEYGEITYPKGHVREDKILGKLSEYDGRVEISAPLTVAEDADNAPRTIRGVLQYQICTDSGTCYPPQRVSVEIPVQMEGGAKATASAAPDTGASATPAGSIATDQTPGQPTAQSSDATESDSVNVLTRMQTWLLSFGYMGAIIVALIGGLILNLMPCVLPVISLKILSFVRQAQEDRARIFWLGMTYSAGILVFFGALAFIYWQTNSKLQWGEQFQRPHVVIGLAAIVTAFSLSLFGVWAVFTPRVINRLGEKAEGEGLLSAFSTGLLATFLGTACTAPFLSAALGAASRFSSVQGAFIFFSVGIGMAAPFVVLAANPAWLKFVPRPGPWMGTFEYLMGFLLLGTVIWIINPLRNQIGGDGLLLSMIFLLFVAIAAWVKGKIRYDDSAIRKARLYALSIGILVIGWVIPFRFATTIEALAEKQLYAADLAADGELYRRVGGSTGEFSRVELDWSRGIPWQRYRRDRALTDVRNGYTIFVDYTADWCANCKTMLKTAIERPEVIAAMKELDIIPYTADYTLPVPEITEDLKRFERGGVPVFVVYRPFDTEKPEILPELITAEMLVGALKRAGPSRPGMTSLVSTASQPATVH
ncbi:MAG: thioredoxin family protein [Planctomycetia bacterium]|nr:thioredoxin family protein [Planctomycetia bacterium]MCC7316577.1 thioredoxin family protein [Planctomycetota bacterium]OQZ02226.1 MAG: hypothetical protein B6D36_13470 [Planctomycetes bacterium UTPLA1]